ncbi:MAG: glycosyltransferase family 39 protein [Phycisphaerales bacterium]|nr:MAG: glycosyltransferase family 39 protein [Phycisphaerales bacterium]
MSVDSSSQVMSQQQPRLKRAEFILLCAIFLLFVGLSAIGSTWGLPSRSIDKYLFNLGSEPWPGERIYRLAGAAEKFSAIRGADVDLDPLDKSSGEPIPLTAREEDVAKIYLRYRLYTYQPDEMITMMALAGMHPGELDLDPRLYQYGGLFIYPVGGLIKVCGIVGLIDVRSDVVFYLDNPDEFGKFYVVARAYAAAWGLVGVAVVFAIGRRLAGTRAGLWAALFFTLTPVAVCMAHEGKPHLPGAVLMLLAVLFAMRHLSSRPSHDGAPISQSARDWWLMCICCGAAFGMVLSSWPIFVLIPLVALVNWKHHAESTLRAARYTGVGVALACGVYLVTNPYIVINALINREVLKSNFGNSLAMYEVSRIAEGLARVIELTVEGATLPLVLLGVFALVVGAARRNIPMVPLATAAVVFFLQFVLIGAGKPAEYGRFGVFTNTALAIGASCLLTYRPAKYRMLVNRVAPLLVLIWTAYCGGLYLRNFQLDTTDKGSRMMLASYLAQTMEDSPEGRSVMKLATSAEPAPYCCPPLDFSRAEVVLVHKRPQTASLSSSDEHFFFEPVDEPTPSVVRFLQTPSRVTPISWANKPFHTGRSKVWLQPADSKVEEGSDERPDRD